MKKNQKILNLGAGGNIMAGAVNVDLKMMDGMDYVMDCTHDWIDEIDNDFDIIVATDLIEHLWGANAVLEFCDRAWDHLNENGILDVTYPDYRTPNAYNDPTHHNKLTADSLDYCVPGTMFGDKYGYYTKKKYKLLEKKTICGNVHIRLKKIAK